MLADQEIERPNCIFFSNILTSCLLNSIPTSKDCFHCYKRIENLSNLIIKHRFSDSNFKINQIHYKNISRNYSTNEDLFQNPHFLPLKEVKYPDPEKKDWIRFNIFNVTSQEYFFEILEIKKSRLHHFIWFLEELGYSEELLSRFNKNIIEMEE